MLSLGIDIGSSSVKVSVYDPALQKIVASDQYPKTEMAIDAPNPGWAEQDPDWWWDAFLKAYALVAQQVDTHRIEAIGIAYQMHGLVCLDKKGIPLRPSIIWCDSRAVEIGAKALEQLGTGYAFTHLLNSPGNFTASKLNWVKSHQPDLFDKIQHICLPGDYLGYRLTGQLTTTLSGLTEGIFYDFKEKKISQPLLDYYGFEAGLLPEVKNCFDHHGAVQAEIAQLLNISPRAALFYKAGDQPNNAFALNVLKPGEFAATAGTSGVVYGVSTDLFIDYSQRVNSFAHVNYTQSAPHIGILLCINGVGIANSWLKKMAHSSSYQNMNAMAATVEPGSAGLLFLPFGNGAERMLQNAAVGASLTGLDFNLHGEAHLYRAVQEGIGFAFKYGMAAFVENKLEAQVIRAGKANLFLSPVFTRIISTLFNIPVELYDADGAAGAARGALVGSKQLRLEEAQNGLRHLETIEPNPQESAVYQNAYEKWVKALTQHLPIKE